MNIVIPASAVCTTSIGPNGPGPTEVYALTLMLYSTNSCRPVRVISVTKPLVVKVESSEMDPPNVISGVNKISYIVIIPFCSIGGSSSQVTKISLEEAAVPFTPGGNPDGAGGEKMCALITANYHISLNSQHCIRNTFIICSNFNWITSVAVTNLIEGHHREGIGHSRVEPSYNYHLFCCVNHFIGATQEVWLCVHDPVALDGGIVVVRLWPCEGDIARVDFHSLDILRLLRSICDGVHESKLSIYSYHNAYFQEDMKPVRRIEYTQNVQTYQTL